jgi:hypothetical protein
VAATCKRGESRVLAQAVEQRIDLSRGREHVPAMLLQQANAPLDVSPSVDRRPLIAPATIAV